MKIIIDAMGGDLAPAAAVKGAIDAAEEFGVETVLVGSGEQILKSLKEFGLETLPQGVEIAHADDVVTMEDDPTLVLRQHKNSSMVIGLKMLANGEGDAFISAGNTGALLSAATLTVKRIHGVRRAAFAPVIPVKKGKMVLVDCGANVECTPEFLLQFGVEGSVYAEKVLGIENPRVAILNNGTEACKGTQLQKDTYLLLEKAGKAGIVNFIGNIEGREAMLGGCDVLVADGFSGNVFLKTLEGTALFLMSHLKGLFKKNALTMLAALICRSGINELKGLMDYRETGGTALLGLRKTVIKAHGSSDARAFRSSVKQAIESAKLQIEEELSEKVAGLAAVKEC